MAIPGLYNNYSDLMDSRGTGANPLYDPLGYRRGGNAMHNMGSQFNDISMAMLPRLFAQVGFGNQSEVGRENALSGMAQSFTPEGLQASVDATRAKATGGAFDEARSNIALMQAHGPAGIGAIQGAGIAANNRAYQTANDLQSRLASPESKAQQLGSLAQIYAMMQATPALDQKLQLYNAIMQRQQRNDAMSAPKGGTLGAIGGILGQALPYFLPGVHGNAIAQAPAAAAGYGAGGGGNPLLAGGDWLSAYANSGRTDLTDLLGAWGQG